MAEEAELIGGISVSIGASDQKLVSDLERAEQLVQAFIKEQRTVIIRAQVQTGGGAGGGAGAAAVSQADVQRMATSALIAVARSPQLPALVARIDRLRPPAQRVAEQQPLAPQRQRRDEPVPVTFRGAALPTSKPGQQEDPLLRSINEELAKNGEFLDHLGGEVQKLPSATAKEQRAPRAQAATRPVAEAEAKVEVPAANIDTSALATQLNQVVATFSSFNERLATAFAAMPSAARPEAGQAPAPVPSPHTTRGRGTRPVAAAVTPVQAAEETAAEEAPAPRRRTPRRRATQPVAEAQAVQPVQEAEEPEQAASIRYNRRGAPILEIPPGETLGSTNVSPATQRLNRYGVQPINIIGGTSLGVPTRLGRQQQARAELEAARAQTAAERDAQRRTLTELSYEAQQGGGNVRQSATVVGTQRTPAQQAEFRRAEEERADRLASRPSTDEERQRRSQQLADDAERRRQQQVGALAEQRRNQVARAADEASLRASRGGRTPTEVQREREIESGVTRQRAAITAAGRTGRTEAFGLGALFGGTQGRFIEASRRQADAQRELNRAERESQPIRERIAEYDRQLAKSPTDQVLQKQRQAYLGRKDVIPILDREVKATRELEAANLALQKLQGPSSIARNLLAGAAGGAAFGLAMTAASAAFSAFEKAAAPALDQLTGFGATSTRVTSALAAQTLAAHGNVEAVLAQTEAQAGLSKQTADTLNAQLRLTTQIKAGALAQEQASELVRAGLGTNRQTPQGLFGGFGGVGGSAFLAQQFGGGKGFTEQISGDINAILRPPGKNPLEDLQTGLSYITNDAVKSAVNSAAKQQGNALPDVLGGAGRVVPPLAVANAINDLVGGKNPFEESARQFQIAGGETPAPTPQTAAEAQAAADRLSLVNGYLEDLSSAAERGAPFVQNAAKVTYEFAQTAAEQAKGAAAAAAAGDAYGYALAKQSNIIVKANGQVVQSAEQYRRATEQTAVGRGRIDPATLAAQFNVADQAMVRALGRLTDFALKTQLPAQAALQNLQQPLLPVGTGIPGGASAVGLNNQQKAIALQKELNAYYVQGQQELINTYKPEIVRQFGAAAGVAFQSQINGIAKLGQEIAGLQADIANTSAAQQTKEYNYQLFIARRTLSDIGGLTGRNFGAGQSYLGVLEKQNLALSRQGQQLQFNLSQRQINFQQALAGFEAPGVTPEERQARIQEAKIEAGFAQKQLDIQRQMFGNQVKIVDIQNLREGADLAKQIGLLISGRRAAIRIAVDQQELILAQKRSEQLSAQAGKYLSAVDTVAATVIGHIQDLETAAGRALSRTEMQAVKLFGNFVVSLNSYINRIAPNINPYGGVGNVPYGPPTHGRGAMYQQQMHAMGAMYQQPVRMNAVGRVSQPTMVSPGNVAGEAGTETVAILRNVRPYNPGGGGSITIGSIFSGPVSVRSNEDIDEIARKVEKAMGRKASQIGLRSVG